MHYRVYSGPKGSPDVSSLEKSQLLFKEFTVLDDALSWARHLEGTGRIPLLIEGDDGTRINRRAIIDALRVGMREQLDQSTLGDVSGLGGKPAPFRTSPLSEVVPFGANHFPVDHGALQAARGAGISHGVV
jgi:hypothetical protein